VRGNQACVKNTDLRHPSFTVVMYKRKFASPVLNVLSQSRMCAFGVRVGEVGVCMLRTGSIESSPSF
jgi:hypothetical protein